MACGPPSLDNRFCELMLLTYPDVVGVYNTNAIHSMQSISQHHQDGFEGYRHHNQATFALFSEIQHLPMVSCGVPRLDIFRDR